MILRDVQQVERAWTTLDALVFIPNNDVEYERLVSVLDSLIDIVGEDEDHPLASLMQVIGVLIERYEDVHVPEIV
jgi:HTH-type transcriptional regulator/antitoxin HigA